MKKLFSIVLPVYNKEKSIFSTVTSILNQTFQDYELIIINDGSTDNTEKVLKQIKSEKINYIYSENNGVSSARNLGIENAQYDWIAFIDGDDLWDKNYLEVIQRYIAEFPEYSIFSTAIKYNENGNEYYPKYSINLKNKEFLIIENFFKASLGDPILSSSSTVVKSNLIKSVGGFPIGIKMGEDLDTWCRISEKSSIVFINKALVTYRKSTENRACLLNEPTIFPYIKNETNLKLYKNKNIIDFRCRYQILLIKYYLLQNQVNNARQLIKELKFSRYFMKDIFLLKILGYLPFVFVEKLCKNRYKN